MAGRAGVDHAAGSWRLREPARNRVVLIVAVVLLVIGSAIARLGFGPSITPAAQQGTGALIGALPNAGSASCAYGYSASTLSARSWAADATVTKIGMSWFGSDVAVMLTVNHWYRGGTMHQFGVRLRDPNSRAGIEDPHPAFQVGTRLLLSGETVHGSLEAWSCGFTRYWDPDTERAWDRALR